MTDLCVRCFVGLKPDEATRQALSDLPRIGRSRPVLPEDLHMTVVFLGDLPCLAVRGLSAQLSELPEHPIGPLRSEGLALWPSAQRARVIVATYEADQALLDLHQKVSDLAQVHGVANEPRRYRPHVTIARLPRTLRVMPQHSLDRLPGIEQAARFTHLGVYSRSPEGAPQRYQALAEYPLPSG